MNKCHILQTCQVDIRPARAACLAAREALASTAWPRRGFRRWLGWWVQTTHGYMYIVYYTKLMHIYMYVYVYVCVYIYICMYIYIYVYMYVCNTLQIFYHTQWYIISCPNDFPMSYSLKSYPYVYIYIIHIYTCVCGGFHKWWYFPKWMVYNNGTSKNKIEDLETWRYTHSQETSIICVYYIILYIYIYCTNLNHLKQCRKGTKSSTFTIMLVELFTHWCIFLGP